MGKIIDLTGQKFGKLTVLRRAEDKFSSSGKRIIYWHCKCECGNECDISRAHLKDGCTKSCGCLRQESAKKNGKNGGAPIKIIPKDTRFGHLIVIELSNNKQNGMAMWKCKCDCGKEIDIPGYFLRKNIIKSCGCLQGAPVKIIPEGTKFGKLTILKLLDERKNGDTVYQCQCECGNIINVCRNSLIKNNTISCGCLKMSKGELKIQEILQNNNIIFEKQKIFQTCKDKKVLPFDFYINNQYIIEFDGIQHFKIGGWNTQENFIKVKEHDEIKNKYCKEYNIPLIRIPYTHLNDLCLEDLLLETSQFIVT